MSYRRYYSRSEDNLMIIKNYEYHRSSLAKSCEYPINYYKGDPLPGLSTVSEPMFSIPETTPYEFTKESAKVCLKEENLKIHIDQFITPESNLLAIMSFLNECTITSGTTLKIFHLGRMQYLYGILETLYPEITRIEVWTKKLSPIIETEKVKPCKGKPSEDINSLMIVISDQLPTDEDLYDQERYYDIVKPIKASLLVKTSTEESIDNEIIGRGILSFQALSSQVRLLTDDVHEFTITSSKLADSICYHNTMTREIWPWYINLPLIENLKYDDAHVYSILADYYSQNKMATITEDVLECLWDTIKNTLHDTIYRRKRKQSKSP